MNGKKNEKRTRGCEILLCKGDEQENRETEKERKVREMNRKKKHLWSTELKP
jgi:hypothetical protein